MNVIDDYKIAFFTNNYLPFIGGVPLSVDMAQRRLRKLGDEVVVFAPGYDEEDDEDVENVRRLPSIRHFNNTDFSLPLPVSFDSTVNFGSERYDAIHVHHPFLLGEMGMSLARKHRLPLVFTYHTQYEKYTHYVPIDRETANRTILRHLKRFCALCDLIVAPTESMRKRLTEDGVESPVEVLPTGLEMERFQDLDPERKRSELGVDDDAKVLVHVGRLSEEKNLSFLMEAVLTVLASKDDARFVVVGDGASKGDLEKLAERSGVGDRVHFLGKQTGTDLIDVYAAGDLFVFASKTETQGMVVAESLAAGTPVVALDADGVRDVVQDGENGALLPEDASSERFAAKIKEALDDAESLAKWRRNAPESVAWLDADALARRLHDLYGEMKRIPNLRLKRETMSFGLIRNYFETVWEDVEDTFTQF